MEDLFGIPAPLLFGQLLLGLINGAFYAMLSLGLAVIFGLLNIVNMAHGALLEKLFISRLYKLDHLYGLLLTFGLALVIEGVFRNEFGSSGLPYRIPQELTGSRNLGFMFLPNYRAWVIVASLIVCIGTWFVIERPRLGAYL